MKLIIDIDEKIYNIIKNEPSYDGIHPYEEIKNGTPLDKIRVEIEEAKMVRVTTNDAIIESSTDVVINPQYRNFTSGLDMAINIIDRYQKGANE